MKGFFSTEAFFALLFILVFVSLYALPAHPKENLQIFYRFQLAQDLAETSVSNPASLDALKGFSNGDPVAEKILGEKYSVLLEELGDYCLIVKASGRVLKLNCREGVSSLVFAWRTIYDGSFFKAEFGVGGYS